MPRVKQAPDIELPDQVTDETPAVETPAKPDTTDTSPAVSAATAELARKQEALEIAAEELFGRLADGQSLTAAERLLLRSAAPADATRSTPAFEKWTHRGASRVGAVRKFQGVAGSGADRLAAAEQAEQARARYETESPAIQERIAALQAELGALAGAVRAAESDVARRAQAVEYLTVQTRLPPRVRDQITVVKHAFEPDKRRFLRAGSDIKALSGALLLDPSTAAGRELIGHHLTLMKHPNGGDWFEVVFPRVEAKFTPREPNPRRFEQREWESYLSLVRAKLVDLRAELEELSPLMDKHREEVLALARYLVPA